jgi:sugar phosphate isomerase/epimerase
MFSRSMTDLGIHYYRWGGFKWDNGRRHRAADRSVQAARGAARCAEREVSGVGHVSHAFGNGPGRRFHLGPARNPPNGFDPKLVGVNYDVGHATIEGGLGGWIESFRITGDYLRGVAVKDFLWEKDAAGHWQAAWKPLGEGMVRFPQFFAMLRGTRFEGPMQLHFEYPLGGAENGLKKDLTMSRADIFAAMKRDLNTFRGYTK